MRGARKETAVAIRSGRSGTSRRLTNSNSRHQMSSVGKSRHMSRRFSSISSADVASTPRAESGPLGLVAANTTPTQISKAAVSAGTAHAGSSRCIPARSVQKMNVPKTKSKTPVKLLLTGILLSESQIRMSQNPPNLSGLISLLYRGGRPSRATTVSLSPPKRRWAVRRSRRAPYGPEVTRNAA